LLSDFQARNIVELDVPIRLENAVELIDRCTRYASGLSPRANTFSQVLKDLNRRIPIDAS
jgi:hypothetical protein